MQVLGWQTSSAVQRSSLQHHKLVRRFLKVTQLNGRARPCPAALRVLHRPPGALFMVRRYPSMQPPLSYYTSVLNFRVWKRVEVLTYTDSGGENPILPVLRMLIDTGSWPQTNITIHTASLVCSPLRQRLIA